MPSTQNRVEPSFEATIRRLPIEFTGSGSEYFRIWIVNLLLLLVTLGLYWPWAKVRRQRYFWGNTLVDGDPLGFHGNPRQMFKGWALVGVLFVLYNFASSFSVVGGMVALLAIGALWPALWRSSMRFQMANTSWRGLRFQFVGNLRGAYFSFLPLALLFVPFVLPGLLWSDDPEQVPAEWFQWFPVVLGVFAVIGLLIGPWLLWRMKAYQHRHYVLGPMQVDFRAPVKLFYTMALKPALLLAVLVAGSGGLMALLLPVGGVKGGPLGLVISLTPLAMIAFVFFGVKPWFTTRLQNLVWTKTGNAQMRFISQLRFRDMLGLSLKNALLIGITLGLYWPFAKVAMARLRLEAVHIRTITDMQALLAAAHEGPHEAAGDAAGDFFGLDVGL